MKTVLIRIDNIAGKILFLHILSSIFFCLVFMSLAAIFNANSNLISGFAVEDNNYINIVNSSNILLIIVLLSLISLFVLIIINFRIFKKFVESFLTFRDYVNDELKTIESNEVIDVKEIVETRNRIMGKLEE